MSRHRYPLRSLIWDDLKVAAGLVLVGGPLFLRDLSSVLTYIFSALAALFLVFAARTVVRHLTVVELSDVGIRLAGAFVTPVGWDDLRALRLRYYSTRRDRERGWMQLRIKGPSRTISIDSSIEGFDVIAERSALEAERRGIAISPLTRTNLGAIGIVAGRLGEAELG